MIMEERIVANASFDKKKILILYVLGLISLAIGVVFSIWVYFNEEFKYYYSIYPVPDYEYVPYYLYKDYPLFFFHYGRKEGFGYFVVLGILLFLVAIIFSWRISKCNLIVSDKFVKGQTFTGTKIDLPIDAISGIIEVKWLNGIKILTTSKKIVFISMKNATEVSKTISDFIATNVNEEKGIADSNNTNADELKKFKELLDMGVITKEEFDQKKKQLLGL